MSIFFHWSAPIPGPQELLIKGQSPRMRKSFIFLTKSGWLPDVCFPVWRPPAIVPCSSLPGSDPVTGESPENILFLSWRALSSPDRASHPHPARPTAKSPSPPLPSHHPLFQEAALGVSFHSLTFVLSPLLLPSQSWKPWQQEGVARETGLPSNQEFPASVSGVTGGFASRAAGWGRKERKRMRGAL